MRSTIEWRNSTLGVLTARCPWCRDLVTVERLDWLADVACPDCGRAMWPVSGETVAVFFRSDAGWDRRGLLDLLARMPLRDVDSLGRVEVTVLFEEICGEAVSEAVLGGTADSMLDWIAGTIR